MQSLQSDVVALESDVDLTNSSYSYLVRTQRIYFIFGNVFVYPSNKYNNNCFFWSIPRILPSVIAPTLQAWSLFKPRAIFHGADRKNNYFINVCIFLFHYAL